MDDKPSYALLNGYTVATYAICYQLKDGVELDKFEFLKSKQEVSAKRFQQFNQQNNLIFVDMLFPNILADIALEVYLKNAATFAEYTALPKTFQIINEVQDAKFLNEKVRKFIEYVLYSDIQNDKQSSGMLHYNRYYSYDFDDKCLYFNEINHDDLVELAFSKLKLSVSLEKSAVNASELVIYLNMKM